MDALFSSFSSFGHDDAHNHYQQIYHTEQIHSHHKASFTHEAIAGAAGFAAMRAYESHLRATGQQPSHALMKELLAGIAAAEVDKLVETKGMDWIDRHKAKKMAQRQAHDLATHRYGGGSGWEYARTQGGYAEEYDYERGMPWGAQGHGGYAAYGYGGGGYQGGYQQGGYPPPQGYPQPPPQQYYQGQGGYGQPEYGGYQQGYEEEHHRHHHHHHHHHG